MQWGFDKDIYESVPGKKPYGLDGHNASHVCPEHDFHDMAICERDQSLTQQEVFYYSWRHSLPGEA